MTTTDPIAEHRDRLSVWMRSHRAWMRRGGPLPQPPVQVVDGVQRLLDDRDALLLALKDARDALILRADVCTAQAEGIRDSGAYGAADELDGEADGRTGGALAIKEIITRFWGIEAGL